MKIEKIPRTTTSNEKSASYMIKITPDEGKKIINQDYLDDNSVAPIIGACMYLADNDSTLNYSEVTEEEATTIITNWEKTQREKHEAEEKKRQEEMHAKMTEELEKLPDTENTES